MERDIFILQIPKNVTFDPLEVHGEVYVCDFN
jgi:hypothetical protein